MTYEEIHRLTWQHVVNVLDSDGRVDWKNGDGCFDVDVVKTEAVDSLHALGLVTDAQKKQLYAYSCCALCVAYRHHCAGCPLERCTCVDDCLYNDVYAGWDREAAVKIRDAGFPRKEEAGL